MVLSSNPSPSPPIPALGPPLRGDAGYRRLVRLLARSFYGGECPPLSAAPPAAPSPAPRRGAPPSTAGLGTVLLDQLSRPGAAWVDEGALSASLRLAPKHVRRALRHLQGQRVVDSAVLRYSFARTDAEGAPLTDDPSLARKRLETRTYWRVDHARLKDAVRLKLHRLRERVRRAVDASAEVQRYRCARCGASFSSLDAPRLLHAASGSFRCLECSAELQEAVEQGEEQGLDGSAGALPPPSVPGSASSRQSAARGLAQRLEAQLAPLAEQLAAIKEDAPPDQGPFQQWFTEQHRAARAAQDRREAARARAAAGGAGAREGDAEARLLAENAAVLVALEDAGAPAAEAGAARAPKETPLWFRREGGARADEDGQSAGVVDAEAEQRRLEAAYLAQYMEAVRAAAGGAAADAGQRGGLELGEKGPLTMEEQGLLKMEEQGPIKLEEQGPLKTEEHALLKTEEHALLKMEEHGLPKLEEQGLEQVEPEAAVAEDEDDEAWEDA